MRFSLLFVSPFFLVYKIAFSTFWRSCIKRTRRQYTNKICVFKRSLFWRRLKEFRVCAFLEGERKPYAKHSCVLRDRERCFCHSWMGNSLIEPLNFSKKIMLNTNLKHYRGYSSLFLWSRIHARYVRTFSVHWCGFNVNKKCTIVFVLLNAGLYFTYLLNVSKRTKKFWTCRVKGCSNTKRKDDVKLNNNKYA